MNDVVPHRLTSGTQIVVPGMSTTVFTSPGQVGPPGAGVNLAGAVPTYADLPDTLGGDDAGVAYLVQSDGKLYVWSGSAWPPDGAGADFRGEVGPQGRSVTSVDNVGDDLKFEMSDGTTESATVPALAAAAESADAAAASAAAAATSARNAADSATGADASALGARDSATAAATSATGAAGSADAAAGSAADAAASATAAAESAADSTTSADAAAASATAAKASQGAAKGSETAAAGSATAAKADAADAAASATAAAGSATTAGVAAGAAKTSADESAASAVESEYWANKAEEIIGDGIPDASATTKGGILLPGVMSGELGGTFDHPAVIGWADKVDTDDPRLTDPRPPAPGSITNAHIAADAAIALSKLAPGNVAGIDPAGAPYGLTIWFGTEEEFAAIGEPDPDTLYFRTIPKTSILPIGTATSHLPSETETESESS